MTPGRESGPVSIGPESTDDRLNGQGHPTARRSPPGGYTSRYGRAALDAECAEVEAAPEGFRTRSLFAAACAVGGLVTGGEVEENVARTSLEQMGRVIGLAEADVRRTVANGLKRGGRTPRSAPTTGHALEDRTAAIAAVINWWAEVSATPGGGRREAMRLKILAAFALLAMGAGKVRLTDSYRQVAEAAGVSVGTLANYVPSLAPRVRVVVKGNRVTGERTVWQLRANLNRPASPVGMASGLFIKARTLSDPSGNVWHRWPCGWRVFCLLSDEEQTAAELAEATGLSVGGVRKILARLAALGMATRDADGGWTAQEPATDPCAEGVDHAAERRERHALQRDAWRRWRSVSLTRLEYAREVDPDTGEVHRRHWQRAA